MSTTFPTALSRALPIFLLLAACASAPIEKPPHSAPLTPDEISAFRKVLGVRESLFQLCDYANLGLVQGLSTLGAQALFQKEIPREVKAKFDGVQAPYTGKGTLEIVPVEGAGFMTVSHVNEALVLKDGSHPTDRAHHYKLRFHCDEDITFRIAGQSTTFKSGATLELELEAAQSWNFSNKPHLALTCADDKWKLAAGAVEGVTDASGGLFLSQWIGAEKSMATAGVLSFVLAGPLPAVKIGQNVMQPVWLGIGEEEYRAEDFTAQLGAELVSHQNNYLSKVLGN